MSQIDHPIPLAANVAGAAYLCSFSSRSPSVRSMGVRLLGVLCLPSSDRTCYWMSSIKYWIEDITAQSHNSLHSFSIDWTEAHYTTPAKSIMQALDSEHSSVIMLHLYDACSLAPAHHPLMQRTGSGTVGWPEYRAVMSCLVEPTRAGSMPDLTNDPSTLIAPLRPVEITLLYRVRG